MSLGVVQLILFPTLAHPLSSPYPIPLHTNHIPIISIPNRSIEQSIRRKVVCIDILLVVQELVEKGKETVFERGWKEAVRVVADFDEAVVVGDAHRCVDGVGLVEWGIRLVSLPGRRIV